MSIATDVCGLHRNLFTYVYGGVTLCCDAYVRPRCSEAGWLNKSSCLAPALGVTKFVFVTDMMLVTLCRDT